MLTKRVWCVPPDAESFQYLISAIQRARQAATHDEKVTFDALEVKTLWVVHDQAVI